MGDSFFEKESEGFENLICLVGPAVSKKNENFRNAIGVKERLAITLIFPANGGSYHRVVCHLCKA